MNKTRILYDQEARDALKNGVNKVARAVVTTLGPKGQNVALSTRYGVPSIVHDGVSVAKRIFLEDPAEDEGAKLVKEAAGKTNQLTGDGTTTVTLLTSEMVNRGMKFISSGANGMTVRKGMESAKKQIISNLRNESRDVKKSEWESIATISAQDDEIGSFISQAFNLVGTEGSIQVEEGAGDKIEIEHKEGFSFEEGYMSDYFITDYGRLNCVYDDANILVTDININNISQFKAIAQAWNKPGQNNKPIIIVCGGMSSDILAITATNKLKAAFPIVVVKAPDQGDRMAQILNDVALFTGAKMISAEAGMKLNEVKNEDFGMVKRVVVDKFSTTIMADPEKEHVDARIAEIKTQMKAETNEFNIEFLKKRMAKLTNGIAILYVGGKTESETKEIRERVYDAVGATRSAIEEGVVLGGGMALYNAATENVTTSDSAEDDFSFGAKLVIDSCLMPMRKLIENCGDDAGQMVERIQSINAADKSSSWGYNAYTSEICDLNEKNILDPFKVVRVALENSVSVAGSILTTACLIVDIEEEKI